MKFLSPKVPPKKFGEIKVTCSNGKHKKQNLYKHEPTHNKHNWSLRIYKKTNDVEN